MLTAAGTGVGAIALTRLLEFTQRLAWGGSGVNLLEAVSATAASRRVLVLLGAGVLTVAGQIVLRRLASGNGIDIAEAIWFHAGRLPALRTLGSAVLSVMVVGMGVSLGREGAPKQAGAVLANFFADRLRLSDEARQLLVACGSGAGMGAAYGVPLGGAVFSLEVVRGALALRFVLPALATSMIATAVSWLGLRDAPTYIIPDFHNSASVLIWALLAGPIAGLASVGYVRAVAWADRNRPEGWQRWVAPIVGLALAGFVSTRFPQVLGNGRDISQLAFMGQAAPLLLLVMLALRPLSTTLCLRVGTPGGLFTPSLTVGAMLGGVLGYGWSLVWPGVPPGLFALLGAAAVLAATTQGPVSTVILMMELTGRDRSFILPMLVAVVTATLTSRTIELRSVYEARLTDEQVQQRRRAREAGGVVTA